MQIYGGVGPCRLMDPGKVLCTIECLVAVSVKLSRPRDHIEFIGMGESLDVSGLSRFLSRVRMSVDSRESSTGLWLRCLHPQ